MKKHSPHHGLAAAVMFMVVLWGSWAIGAPGFINYQGKLTNASGGPITQDGVVMVFRIFDDPTVGRKLWEETQTVDVEKGIYSVVLGSVNLLLPSLFSDDARWLELSVSGETLTPRQRLTAVAYSLNADTLDGKHSSELAPSSHGHSFSQITGMATDAQIPDAITVNYAASSGNADTLDAKHASEFAASTHGHSFSQLAGTATDAQVPDSITINYAASAGNADTLDAKHASEFAAASHLHDGSQITTGTVADARIPTTISRTSHNHLYQYWSGVSSTYAFELENTGTGDAFRAYSHATGASAAINASNTGTGTGVYGYSSEGYGVRGVSGAVASHAGYFTGYGSGLGGSAVYAENLQSTGGMALWARNASYDTTAVFSNDGTGFIIKGFGGNGGEHEFAVHNDGTVYTEGGVEVVGTGKRVRTPILEITGGADLSEHFRVTGSETPALPAPGTVVSIDPENPGSLAISSTSYDRKVAGIVSGAGGINPGLLMGQQGTAADGSSPVALSGRVYCLVDASYGPVEPGDLLTSSPTPGHAMRVTDYTRAQGAIIGKAMTSHRKGKGLALVLVTLQ